MCQVSTTVCKRPFSLGTRSSRRWRCGAGSNMSAVARLIKTKLRAAGTDALTYLNDCSRIVRDKTFHGYIGDLIPADIDAISLGTSTSLSHFVLENFVCALLSSKRELLQMDTARSRATAAPTPCKSEAWCRTSTRAPSSPIFAPTSACLSCQASSRHRTFPRRSVATGAWKTRTRACAASCRRSLPGHTRSRASSGSCRTTWTAGAMAPTRACAAGRKSSRGC